MIFIDNLENDDPAENLALEEFLSKNLPAATDYFLLYQNRPAVVLGRNQNVAEEVDLRLSKANKIAIHRRISGGGAVYHDSGNLNYSFLQPHDTKLIGNWKLIVRPILEALHKLKVPIGLNARNDLLVEGKKVSGTAQNAGRNLMISHGTLLFDSDLDTLFHVLNPEQQGQIRSQSLKSFRSKVTNLKAWLPEGWQIRDLREYLRQEIAPQETYTPSKEEWQKIRQLADEKYRSWDWNFGRSPDFEVIRKASWKGQPLEVQLKVRRGGLIESVSFSQDNPQLARLAQELPQSCYREEDLRLLIQRHIQNPEELQQLLEILYS